jgi:glucokinase-like ROK family protein
MDDARYLIGIDLANSEFRGGVLNLRGQAIHRLNLPVDEQDGEAALELAFRLVDELVIAATRPLLGIGIGTPGLMDPQQGLVRRAVNLGWRDLPLRDLLTKRYNLPVYIANDSQVAALAEYTFGRTWPTPHLVVVKVGRGIGAGIVIDGQLYWGDGFGAGEIGHVQVVEKGERCGCGHFGCLETVASSRAIIRKAQAIAQSNPSSVLHQFATPGAINTEAILQAAEAGDEALQAVIAEVGHYLGIAVANLVGALNIHHVVIAGSVARFGEALLEPIRQEMKQRSMEMLAVDTCVETSHLGQDIVIQGAAALLLTNELGIV